MDRRRKTRENQGVRKEDRAQPYRHLDKDVTRIRAKGRLGHSTADDTAQAAVLRLLEHYDQRQQKAYGHFYDIEKTN